MSLRARRYAPVLVVLLALGCASPPPASPTPSTRPAQPADPPELVALVGHMSERLALAVDVARAKWNAHRPVDDPEREASLLAAIRDGAAERGLSRYDVEPFFRGQIEAGKIVQRALIARWTAASAPPFADAPDLQRDVRPRIDAINAALLDDLRVVTPRLYGATGQHFIRQRAKALLVMPDEVDADTAVAVRREALHPLLRWID